MEHYDGPVFRNDDKPAPTTPQRNKTKATKADNDDVKPTYHSVDPMSQFVTPPSTIPRKPKPEHDFAAVRRNMRRADAEVVLMATEADADVPFTDTVLQPEQPVTAASEQGETADQPAELQSDAEVQAVPQPDDETYSTVHKKVTSEPETVVEPTTDADILSVAADAAESEHIPATLTELAEQGRIQSRQVQKKTHAQKKQQSTKRPIFTGSTRPNRYNIHQAFAEYKSSQTGNQKRHH